jgi:hypothetical protein
MEECRRNAQFQRVADAGAKTPRKHTWPNKPDAVR